MKFRSERLVFREVMQDDFKLLYSLFSNTQVMKYAYIDKYNSEEEMLPYFNKILQNNVTPFEDRKAFEFAVFSASEGSFVGFADVEIHNINDSGGCGEIGYFLLPEFWGRGYAGEIANALTEISFKHLRLHKLSARCNSNNTASEKVMKKAGMTKEGELRKVRFKNGCWDSEKVYGILKDEWKLKPVGCIRDFSME